MFIMALSEETIEDQLNYLNHQGYLDSQYALTDQGQSIVQVEKLLQNHSPKYVAIDQFSGKNVIALCTDEVANFITEDLLSHKIDVRLPVNRQIQKFNQQKELIDKLSANESKRLLELLNYFWPDDSLLHSAHFNHWDFTLKTLLEDNTLSWLPVGIPSNKMLLAEKLNISDVGVALPVLEINRYFLQADDYPWSISIPISETIYIELLGNNLLDDSSTLTDAPCHDKRVLVERGLSIEQPKHPPLNLSLGVTVHYHFRRRYQHLLMDSSLMKHVNSEFGFFIIGDQFYE